MYELIAWPLQVFYQIWPNYAIAISMVTLLIMIILLPLTLKGTRSMLALQKLQPELRKIQAKYKDDRQKLNEEMMAFYKENGINPLSGCVPVMMQAPIFLVLYGVLRGITTRNGGNASAIGRVAGLMSTDQRFEPWKLHDQVFKPLHLDTSGDLYKSLHSSTKMSFFGVDLALSPLDALRIGVVTAIPFLALIVLMLISQLIQNRQIQGRTKNQQINPQQQMIMKILPFTLPLISLQFPAGLGLYYFVQGLCRIGLQGYITRAVYGPHHEKLEADELQRAERDKATKSPTKGDAGKGAGSSASAPKSAKSQAVQRKASGTGPVAGRRSGDPRAAGKRPSSGSKDEKG